MLNLDYGMKCYENKLEVVIVHYDGYVRAFNGELINEKYVIVYLGSLLSADGTMYGELA